MARLLNTGLLDAVRREGRVVVLGAADAVRGEFLKIQRVL
jgi:hypothetical protein